MPSPLVARVSGLCVAGLAAILLTSGAALAVVPGEGLRMTVEQPHFTCDSGGRTLSHVAFRPGREPADHPVLPCCDGQIGCAQFLSTNTVVRPGRRWRG